MGVCCSLERESRKGGYGEMASALAGHTGGIVQFVKKLTRDGVPYLSYSKIASVESCPYRYHLEYVQRVRLRPEPTYFIKGRIFHKAAARLYSGIARGTTVRAGTLDRLIEAHDDETDRLHLRNAVELLRQNALADWEVIGIEEPFVLSLGRGLPPCLGVIDLILRKDGVFAVIDHKTGRTFGNADDMQLTTYRQYIARRYRTKQCLAYFDEYRWVNNLGRIRKPAFQRQEVCLSPAAWNETVGRFRRGYRMIRQIEAQDDGPGTGACYMCPFRDVCEKATYSTFSRW